MRHFVNILDHPAETLERLLARCAELKARHRAGLPDRLLLGQTVMTIFEKPSTRTRVSLEAAAASMGAHAVTQELPAGSRLGEREPIKDVARVLSRYVALVAARTFAHESVEELARWSGVPVINALSDHSHPTQAMADMLTIREHLGSEKNKRLVFVGDGNNVARSLAAACGRLGMAFTIACPRGYELSEEYVQRLTAECPGLPFEQTDEPTKAVAEADVLYTDVWASMGQEEEAEERRRSFEPFQVNAGLLAEAPDHCVVMHDLPAHRDEEITDEVIEHERSIVFDQAENRMHLYRGLYAELLDL